MLKTLYIALACVLGFSLAHAEDSTFKEGAKDVGHAVGTAVREVGEGAKKVGKEVAQAAREVGHATRDGAKEFAKAVKSETGEKSETPDPKPVGNDK